jgi:hypothetical protein
MTFSARIAVVAILGAGACGTAACGAKDQSATPPPPAATVTVTATPSPTAALSPSATPTAAALTTAGQYARVIAKNVPSAKKVTVLNEKTDSNNLLGRPNGYNSAAVITDTGGDTSDPDAGVAYGATVEAFDSKSDAVRRSDYIQGILKDAPMLGTEYNYVRDNVLLRVSGELPSSIASKYKAAFTAAAS